MVDPALFCHQLHVLPHIQSDSTRRLEGRGRHLCLQENKTASALYWTLRSAKHAGACFEAEEQ